MLKNHLLFWTSIMLLGPTDQSESIVHSFYRWKWSNQMLNEVEMENCSPSCQFANHQNSNNHTNTDELRKPVKHEAAINTRFRLFVAPSERKRTKKWSVFGSMLASRKFLSSPQRLSSFQHRIKPMNTEQFETKTSKPRLWHKDAESLCFVFWFDWWKNGQHPAVSFFKNQKQLINRPASFAAQNENKKMSNIMSRNAKYKVFHELGWLVTFMFPKTGPLGAVHSILQVNWCWSSLILTIIWHKRALRKGISRSFHMCVS
jgi:hypothetical protein